MVNLIRLAFLICRPRMHWAEGGGGLFGETTAGILQPNGHVFILGCFLITHWEPKRLFCFGGLQQTNVPLIR